MFPPPERAPAVVLAKWATGISAIASYLLYALLVLTPICKQHIAALAKAMERTCCKFSDFGGDG